MEDLEQQCEDEVLAVSEARGHYSVLCADELSKCIQLNNELHMMKVQIKPGRTFQIPKVTEQQEKIFTECLLNKNSTTKFMDNKLQGMLHKIENLASIQEQIEREKTCAFNALLKN